MKIKRIISGILSVCLAVSIMTPPMPEIMDEMTAFAAEESQPNDGTVNYSFQNGTLTITGLDQNVEQITLPDTIDGQKVRQINQPSGQGIMNCPNLKTVTLPKYLTSLPDFICYNCPSLTSVTIPDGVTSIGQRSFTNCKSLSTITLPPALESIGGGAFGECVSLTEITLPDGIKELQDAFMSCTGLTKVILPEGLGQLENSFFGCTSLTEITIPGKVRQMCRSFDDCTSLSSIHIPASVTDMTGSFAGCSKLEAITVAPESKAYSSADGVLLSKNRTKLLQYPQAKKRYRVCNTGHCNGNCRQRLCRCKEPDICQVS